jgi:signal peptidase I
MQEQHSLPTQPDYAQPFINEIQTAVPQPAIRQGRSFARELAETVLLIVAIYAFVNLATARFVVDGHSMLPNFDTDQFIIVSRLSYILGEPRRGDVVVFHYPEQPDRDFIKRVIGLPGETVTILEGLVYINGKKIDEPYIENFCRGKVCDGEWVIGEHEFFVLGDNRGASKDSQDFGPVDRKFIIGRAFVRYWPPQDWGLVKHWSYPENGAVLPTLTPTPTQTPTLTPTPLPPPSGVLAPDVPQPTVTRTPGPGDYWSGGYYD